MPSLRHPTPQSLRLSRESIDIFDEVSREMGGISRRAAVEIVARFVSNLKDTRGCTFADLLIAASEDSPKHRRR